MAEHLLIRKGRKSVSGSHIQRVSFSGFSETPVVTAIIENCKELGPTVSCRNTHAGGTTFYCYYNGGEELKKGATIAWTAIGLTNEERKCDHCASSPHECPPNVYF